MSEHENRPRVGQVIGGRYRMMSDGDGLDVGLEYKAYDMQLERLAVVTILDRRFDCDQESMDRLAEVQQRVADLGDPALPPIEEIGIVDGRLYLVRSPLKGRTLASFLARSGLLDVREVLKIAVAMCRVLMPLHRAHLVHGGLSPTSVLVADDGSVTLSDAGVFPALHQRASSAPDQPWGRLPYISPEQATGGEARAASDVYVLGLLMYEMLAGRPPFRRGDEAMTVLQHTRYDPPALEILVPDVPHSLAQIVHTALSKEPASRYRNAGQLARILGSQLGWQTDSEPPHPEPSVYTLPRGPMVVPAPPPAVTYQAEESDWVDEEAGVDWIMVALLAAALVMVLGLIPLWHTVYRRYAIPSPPPAPRSYQMLEPAILWPLPGRASPGWQVLEPAELGAGRLVCYNQPRSSGALLQAVHRNLGWSEATALFDGFWFGSPDYSVRHNLR